ncbi:FecR family protein [Luteibacter sp. E-22]|uniref:FecR family protein n=1 Tax=Luteibacter sp. E-22 TaxID=3404050 RepID=UPI003CF42F1A
MNDRRITEEAAGWYLDMRENPGAPVREQFLAWLRRSPQHVAEYLAIARLHGDMRAVAALDRASLDELRALAATEPSVVPLRRDQETGPREVSARQRRRPGRWAAAASVLLLAAMAWFLGRPSVDTPGIRYAATADGVRTVTLVDDTRIQLSPGSIVDVRFDGRSRRIELVSGDASFDVGRDATRPLKVDVGGQRIEDIGTVFNVSRRAGDIEVSVISGRVAISNAPAPWLDRARLRLTGRGWPAERIAEIGGGETARVSTDGRLVGRGKADVATVATWLPTEIHFHDTPVADVARRFNAYTATPLSVDDPVLAEKRISGAFHARDPEAFVSYLGSLPDVHVVREPKRIRFTSGRGSRRL